MDQNIKQAFLESCYALRQIVEENPETIGLKVLQDIDFLENQIRDYHFKVYLIGGFSCGKSSLLNAWLGKQVLPTGLTPETAVSSELYYSQDERLELYSRDDEQTPQILGGVNDENWEIVKQRANNNELTKVEVWLNHPILEEYADVCLVDMPGLNSSIPAHDYALNQFLLDGSPFILCIPMSDGTVQKDEIAFLDKLKAIKSDGGFFLHLLLTKADEKRPDEQNEIRSHVVEIIREKMGIPAEELKSGVVSIRNGFDDFSMLLESLIEAKDEIFKMKFLPQLEGICAEAQRPLRMMLSQGLSTTDLDAQLSQIQASKEQLSKKKEGWQRDIEREIPAATTRIIEKTKSALFGMKRQFIEQIKNGYQCSHEISSTMKSTILYEMDNEAHVIFDRVINKVANEYGSVLTVASAEVSIAADSMEKIQVQRHTGGGLGLGAAGGAAIGFAVGSWFPVIGNLVGAGVGAVLGAIGGGAYGHAMADTGKLETELSQQLEQQAEAARPAIIEAFNKTACNFNDELEEVLNHKLSTIEEQVQNIQSEKKKNQEDFMARQAHCQEYSSRIDEILARHA